MKRYDLTMQQPYGEPDEIPQMIKYHDGKWVKYSDVKKIIEEFQWLIDSCDRYSADTYEEEAPETHNCKKFLEELEEKWTEN